MEQSLLQNLQGAIAALSWIEIWAVITGLIYVILAAREQIWCWFFGIISSALSIYLFYTGQLYAESILYVYYVVAGFYGWYAWKGRSKESVATPPLQIHTWTVRNHLLALFIGSLLSLILAWGLARYTDAQIPLLDSFTTIFSFIATYMVTRKVLENWLYWIVIDIVTSGMYFYRGFYLYALLMVVYTLIAAIGYYQWKRLYDKDLNLYDDDRILDAGQI